NVRFDYSFVKAAFADLGYTYSRKTLCTVRLSRALLPGLPSYSLGKLCASIGIELENRHRAFGDAEATAHLFTRLMDVNRTAVETGVSDRPEASASVKAAMKQSLLPPNLPPERVAALPDAAGVYNFWDADGRLLYVGKSISIRKRIAQHFAVEFKSRKSAEFKNSITDITWELTGSELVALLYESHLIKLHKPPYNRAQRRSVFATGVFLEENADGYLTFRYGKADTPGKQPVIALNNGFKAKGFLFHKVAKYQLCQKLCDLYRTAPGASCFDYQVRRCAGACVGQEPKEDYNKRVLAAVASFTFEHESFVVIGRGRQTGEKTIVVVEHGRYRGFGYADEETVTATSLADFKELIQPYVANKDTDQIIRQYLRSGHADRVVVF
ncbi:MAG: GIY-YIG nuclease family protein, partial [Hymenobacteraceae bacterium]|nr:GIY-YIG nuclease family protein [Hymenobacteraceae bacterium]